MKKSTLIFMLSIGIYSQGLTQLIDNSDGTISYQNSGLMWLKNANYADTRMNWEDANNWAENLEFAGYDDWRLPSGEDPDGNVCNSDPDGNCTQTEFWTLWEGYQIHVFQPEPFENIGYRSYWTSTEWPENTDKAMAQDLDDWGQNDFPKTNEFFAWAVRSAGAVEINKGVALLHDLSGSMSWSYNGDYNPPEHHQRVSIAKKAAIFFLDLLNEHAANEVHLGIAEFPKHPWSPANGCIGNTIEGLGLLTTTSYNNAKNNIIPNLQTGGNTPLLAGLWEASNMFTDNMITYRSIVLFSDGYHNCPGSVSSGDIELSALINDLYNKNIKVSTIGFARAEDIDESILNDIATGTYGRYYSITGPTFDPDLWEDPQEIPDLALKETYKNILVNDLELAAAITDPVVTLERGSALSLPVAICDADILTSFFITWAIPGQDKVSLKLISSDGEPVPSSELKVTKSETHTIMSIPKKFMAMRGKVGTEPWKMIMETDSTLEDESIKCLYGAIASSGVKMKVKQNKKSYSTGDGIILTATIKQGDTLIKGLSEISARISVPEMGRGNWFVKNFDTAMYNYQVDKAITFEIKNPLQKAARFISDVKGIQFPYRTQVLNVKFMDNGTNEDVYADDGVYTAVFNNTEMEGSYIFNVVARGQTKKRTWGVTSENININVKEQILKDQSRSLYKIIVTPMDNKGNYLGPGYANKIKINVSKGDVSGKIIDHLNGEYSRSVVLSSTVDPRSVKVSVVIGNVATTTDLVKPFFTCKIIIYLIIIIFVIIIIIQYIICKRRVRRISGS
ncbi:MAG: DUF1566 domain-containing protein [Bacteroidetes bacterium]|nr:DUF1566 domain-containing protein [Bacteroidota bacterium]